MTRGLLMVFALVVVALIVLGIARRKR